MNDDIGKLLRDLSVEVGEPHGRIPVKRSAAALLVAAMIEFPEQRIGQVVVNAASMATDNRCQPFYIEDEDLLRGLRQMIASKGEREDE